MSDEYFESNQHKRIQLADIVMARSGEGTIGKVAFIEIIDPSLIFCDFTMRIRLKNYDPYFAYLYLRTSYFQALVEIDKKGLGNNTNIFPNQIVNMPMLNIKISEQKRIASEVKKRLSEQSAKREEIKKIMEDLLSEVKSVALLK